MEFKQRMSRRMLVGVAGGLLLIGVAAGTGTALAQGNDSPAVTKSVAAASYLTLDETAAPLPSGAGLVTRQLQVKAHGTVWVQLKGSAASPRVTGQPLLTSSTTTASDHTRSSNMAAKVNEAFRVGDVKITGRGTAADPQVVVMRVENTQAEPAAGTVTVQFGE